MKIAFFLDHLFILQELLQVQGLDLLEEIPPRQSRHGDEALEMAGFVRAATELGAENVARRYLYLGLPAGFEYGECGRNLLFGLESEATPPGAVVH